MKLFIILLILPLCILGTDLFDLYINHLPDNLKNQEQFKENIASVLKLKAEIHPNLIYYQLLLYRYQNNASAYIDSIKLIDDINKKYLLKRYHWAINQKQINNTYLWEDHKRNFANSFLKRYESFNRIDIMNDNAESEFDHNKRDYYTYIYLTKKHDHQYQPDLDYSTKINNAHKIIMTQLCNIYMKHPELINDVTKNDIRDIISIFYFNDEHGLGVYKVCSLNEVLSIAYDKIHNFNKFRNGYIHFGYQQNKTLSIQKEFFAENAQYAIEIDTHVSEYIIMGGYRIPLKSHLSSFSLLDIGLYYTAITDTTQYQRETHAKSSYEDNGMSLTGNVGMTIHNLSLKNYSTFGITVFTPLLIIKNWMFFDFGFNFGLSEYKYDIDYEFILTRKEGFTAGTLFDPYYATRTKLIKRIRDEETITDTKFFIAPKMRIKFQIGKYLSIDSYFQYKLYSAGLTIFIF
ncbi:hypothetical protein ACFL4L_06120 [bacterium]